jgi:hypothetical protein
LHGGHRLHGVRAANRLYARLRETEVLYLACGDQLLDRTRNVFDRKRPRNTPAF